MQDITDLNQLYPQSESVPVTEALLPWVRIVQTMNETEKNVSSDGVAAETFSAYAVIGTVQNVNRFVPEWT